jgi:DnaJ-class molecular chaperone
VTFPYARVEKNTGCAVKNDEPNSEPCLLCRGTGSSKNGKPCTACLGTGEVLAYKKVLHQVYLSVPAPKLPIQPRRSEK